MKTLRLFALITALAAVSFGMARYFLAGPPPVEPGPHLAVVFPDALTYELRMDGPFPYYMAMGPQGPAGALFVTSELVPGVKGYAGEVPVLAGMTPDGRLTGIRILANSETPSYMARVDRPAFTGQFVGKNASDQFVLDEDVDGVTRATMTTAAVADGVRLASRKAAAGLFGLAVPEEGARPAGYMRDPAVYLLALLMAATLILYARGRAGGDMRAYRWAVLAGAFGVVGVYRAMPVSLGNYFNLTALRLPGPEGLAWYMLVVGALVLAVFRGRLYCGWLCPYGALQEALGRLPVRKLDAGPRQDGSARVVKYGLLWAVTVAAFATGLIEIGGFEPFVTLFSWQGGLPAWGLVGVTLAGSAFVPRLWCRYLCPVGALLGLVSRYSPLRPKPFEGCTSCGACAGVCSMGNRADGESGASYAECIGCNSCAAVCPERRKA